MRQLLKIAFAMAGIATLLVGCGSIQEARSVVAYVSEDQVFSDPILRDFERETGIRVYAVFDTEETKSTGVMNRLLAERNNPQADVFWANEPIRAERLKQEGLLTPYVSSSSEGIPAAFKDAEGYWTGFSARSRPLVVYRNVTEQPASILDYTDPRYRGRTVIANPLFGTTTVAVAVLFLLWGDEPAVAFLERMKENDVRIASSNGESADLVASGEFMFSWVDSDDVFSRISQGKPVEIVHPDQGTDGIGTLILPNAVMLIRGSPNPDNGKQLIDYLLSKETERKLASSDAAQIPLHGGVEAPPHVPRIENLRAIEINYAEVAQKMTEIQPYLKQWVGY